MLWFITIALAMVSVALFLHVLRLRRLLGELDNAVRSRRRLLLKESADSLERIGALRLVDSLNGLIDLHNKTAAEKTGYSSQVDAMLGAVQEVVIIFDSERMVQYANHAAERLFRGHKSLQGLRLEGFMRSIGLLEFLDEMAANQDRADSTQLKIVRGQKTYWFEASCAPVIGIGEGEGMSTLLVLHDITKLKELEVMRREFVANVSHELRTPLTIIKGFAETLIDDAETLQSDSRERFTKKILTNADRLHVLVEDLLTISRLESKPEQIEPIAQPLKPLFEEVAENYRTRLDPATQRIDLAVEDEVDVVLFDRYRIHQVLDNFIENAFRYAPNFTRITLEAKLDSERQKVLCAVVDDGPGIPEKDLPHVFERFYRVDKGRSRERGGTGLGLSIVKHIIQLHGGSVSAESRLGEGSRMRFTLPAVEKPGA
jgi:signal transduction histidine kinase